MDERMGSQAALSICADAIFTQAVRLRPGKKGWTDSSGRKELVGQESAIQ